VTVYSNENAELYLRMLRDHENLVIQNGSKKAIEDANVNLRKTLKEYNTANAVVNPSEEETARRVTLKQDWRAAQQKCLDIVTAAFSLFRLMLDGTAREQWDMIDVKVHSDSTHTDLQGLTLSRECLILSCLPKPSFADMACRVGDMSATCLWSCRRHKKMLCRPWGRNDTTFEDMSQ